MGIFACRASGAPRLIGLVVMLAALTLSLGPAGCKSGGRSKVTAGLFLAPFTEPSTAQATRGIRLRAAKNDFLRAERPTLLESEFDAIQPEGLVLGRLSTSRIDTGTGKPAVTENLLIYDQQSRALLSASLISSDPSTGRSHIRLHYSSRGLDEEEGQSAVLSPAVTPIKLLNGWILTFDSSSKNIVAFREEEPRQIVDDLGARTVAYRSPVHDGRVDPESKNFGHGNGLAVSVVISGEEIVEQIRVSGEPAIARLVEIEENKVLMVFATGTVRAVHLLELTEETTAVDFDLEDPIRPSEKLEVKRLRGKIKTYPPVPPSLLPSPLLAYRTVAERITGNENLSLDSVQPVVFTHPKLPVPFALLFDRTTSSFLKLRLVRDEAGAVTGAETALAVSPASFAQALQGVDASTTVDPPFDLRNGFQRHDAKSHQVFFFESKSASVIAYNPDPALGTENSIKVFVNSAGFLFRRDPRGNNQGNVGDPDQIDFAVADIRLNRLAFDRDFRQLISVSYSSGVIVVVANASEISVVTNDPIADLTYIEPLDENSVRAFDLRTTSLLDFKIGYTAFPIRVQ